MIGSITNYKTDILCILKVSLVMKCEHFEQLFLFIFDIHSCGVDV